MPPAINLVCTRCTDHNHAALQRWYNDHAQLLMASPELQGAQLFRLKNTTASIDYFCLYQFAQISDFPAFDSGEVMSQVRELSNAAPGRSSIDIVKRTQYERVLHRSWGEAQGGSFQASLLVLKSSPVQNSMRWLNDVIYTVHLEQSLQSVQVYAAKMAEHTELFVIMQSVQPLPLNWHASESAYAARADIQSIWQAQADRVATWLR